MTVPGGENLGAAMSGPANAGTNKLGASIGGPAKTGTIRDSGRALVRGGLRDTQQHRR